MRERTRRGAGDEKNEWGGERCREIKKRAPAFGSIKGKEKRASARHTRRRRSRQERGRSDEEEESVDTGEESEFKVGREGGIREKERTKRRNVSGRDCVTESQVHGGKR